MGGAEDREEVWTEVLSDALSVVWAWDGFTLAAFVTAHDGYRVDDGTMGALERYSDDKEMNLIVKEMYDDSDFEGSLKAFVEEELKA